MSANATAIGRCELFNFVFRSAGASSDLFSENDNLEELIVDDLSAQGHNMVLAQGVSADFNYPVLKENPPKAFKNVRKGYLSIWNTLVNEGGDDLLFGTSTSSHGLLDSLIDFLTTLSEHKVRSLRHAATLGGLHLMLALWSKYDMYTQQGATQTQMIESDTRSLAQMIKNAELHGNKSVGGIDPKSRASAIVSLKSKIAGMKEAVEMDESSAENCKTCAEALFQGIFAHRYRDAAIAIRVDVLEVLETLLLKFPDQFLNNSHLKFPGWLLSDQSPQVRKRSLDLLSNLMSLPHELINQTHEFVNRFRNRLLELGRDVDDSVAAAAVRFLRLTIASGGAALVSGSKDLEIVQEGLVSSSPVVRSEVGLLLCEQLSAFKLEQEGGGSNAAASAAASGGEGAGDARKRRSQIESLVTIGSNLVPDEEEEGEGRDTSSSFPSHSGSEVMPFIASAFWPHSAGAVLTDWDAFRSYLLGRASSGSGGRSSSSAAATKGRKKKGRGSSTSGKNGEEEDDAEDEEEDDTIETRSDLSDKHALFGIRLLHSCIWRSVGEGLQTGGRVGVPAAANESTPFEKNGYLTSPSDEKAILRSKSTMSSGVCLLLPELMARYGDSPECSALLSNAVLALSVETFAISRHSKALTSLLYQLQRQLMLHVSPTALTSISSALLFLARESHAKNREALKEVQRLVAKLSSEAVRMGKGILDTHSSTSTSKHGSKRSGGKGKSKGTRKSKRSMADENEDEEEDDDENEDEDDSGVSSTFSHAAVSGLSVTLRRLRVLSNQSVDLDLPIAEFESGSPFLTSVKKMIEVRTDVMNQKDLFKRARSADASSSLSGQAAALESLSPSLVREALLLLCSSAECAIYRAIKVAASLNNLSSSEEVLAVEDKLVPDAITARNDAISTCVSLLLTKHCDGKTGGAPTSKDALEIPITASPFERAYILRIRYAAFSSLCHLGLMCSSQQMRKSDVLSTLAYIPSESDEAAIMSFANKALDMTARDLATLGFAIKHPYLRSKEEAALASETSEQVDKDNEEGIFFTNDDLDELEMKEEDTQMTQAASQIAEEEDEKESAKNAAAGGAGGGTKRTSSISKLAVLSSTQSVNAKETAKNRMLHIRDESVKLAKAMLILKPLAELSLSTPTTERLGHTVSRRALEDDVEVGSYGLPLVNHMMAKIRETAPSSLMAMQLRSALDAASGLQRMRTKLPDDEDAHADFWFQLTGMVDLVVSLVHRQSLIASGHALKSTGKAPRDLAGPIVSMLSDGIVKALSGAPERCIVFSLLAIYLPLLDLKGTTEVKKIFEKHAFGVSSGGKGKDDDSDTPHLTSPASASSSSSSTLLTSEQKNIFKASLSCFRTRIRRGMSCEADAVFEGVEFSELQAWIPAACFYDLLSDKSGKALEHAKRALRACLGLHADARELTVGGRGTETTPAKSTGKGKGKKATKRRRSKASDGEEEEEEEQGEETGGVEGDEDEDEEEQDNDDDDDVGFQKKSKKKKQSGGRKAKKPQQQQQQHRSTTKSAVFSRKTSLSGSGSLTSSQPSSTFLSALIGGSTSTGGKRADSSSSSSAAAAGAGVGAASRRSLQTTKAPVPVYATDYSHFTQGTGVSLTQTQRPNIDDDDE